jgi:hypothetical protein
MLAGCKNCGGYFTAAELERRKPPVHRWPLTAAGERMLAENTSRGSEVPCPSCGQNTLANASPSASPVS